MNLENTNSPHSWMKYPQIYEATLQWRNKWSIDFHLLQRQHMSNMVSDTNPILNVSAVEILPATANQQNASNLGVASPIQTDALRDWTELHGSISL